MSRASTGTVAWRPNVQQPGTYCWHGRWTRADGTRTNWIPLPGDIPEHDEEGARKSALQFAPAAKATTRDGVGESVAAYSIRWLASRTKKTAKDNASHLTHHVLPVIGNVSILGVTDKHGDELVAALDRKIAAGEMSDKTARNVWATIRRMMKDAAHAKPATGLRCLDSNPLRDVMPPERCKTKKARQFLYPSEFLALVGCSAVPLTWKRNVSIAVFLGLRDGEQRALRWEHVDLDHGIVNVCEVFDRTSKAVREGTKTDAGRTVPIPAPLLPLLASMHEAADGTGLVCRGIASQRAMARGLRTWLRRSGVTRAALHDSTSVNLPIRWHDLRATCGTWLAVQGRGSTEIRDVLGHTQVSMTDRYLRNASAVRGGQFGEPFPALPAIGHSIVIDASALPKLPISNEVWRGGRDSKKETPTRETAISADDRPSETRIDSSPLALPRAPSVSLDSAAVTESIDELRGALTDAIRDRAWRVVEIIQGQIDARERAALPDNVVPLVARRSDRT